MNINEELFINYLDLSSDWRKRTETGMDAFSWGHERFISHREGCIISPT